MTTDKDNGYQGKPASEERKPSVRAIYFIARLALPQLDEEFPENAAEASELIARLKERERVAA